MSIESNHDVHGGVPGKVWNVGAQERFSCNPLNHCNRVGCELHASSRRRQLNSLTLIW